MNQTLAESLQTTLSSLDGVMKFVHEKDSLMHFVSEDEVSYLAQTELRYGIEDKLNTFTINIHLLSF